MTDNKVDLQLKQIVENIEATQRDISELKNQEADIYKEAKSAGFEPKIIRKIIAIRKKDQDELQEEEYLIETYQQALGNK